MLAALTLIAVSALTATATHPAAQVDRREEIVIEPALFHLGDDDVERWKDVSLKPQGGDLLREFTAVPRDDESLLFVTQEDINHTWSIEVNGQSVGRLDVRQDRVERVYVIPGGVLNDGANRLLLRADRAGDDVILGEVRLVLSTRREHFRLGRLQVRVTDAAQGSGLPARVTIVDDAGARPELFYYDDDTPARPGIAYTFDGVVDVELAAGHYRVYATRGMEWSLDQGAVDVSYQAQSEVELALTHEVDTTGFVAADTHIHTLQHSGHGDASERERLITLAGEAVELAVATDHNHNIDYRPLQRQLGLTGAFTPVVGNEVTTKVGHFNAFPLDPNDAVPPYEIDDWVKDWVKVVGGMRDKGARVVILNHPRWPEIATGPFGKAGLNRASGESTSGPDRWLVDAIEVINSGTLQPDPMYLLNDWFALMNRGERILAVGSSDSHTVGNIVGQGRTYVRSSADDPGAIDIDEACGSFESGDISVALGIFVDLLVDGRYKLGDLVPANRGSTSVSLRAAAPSWIHPRTAHVFVNGVLVASREIRATADAATDETLEFVVPIPAHDAHLVCAVVGDGVKGPYWTTDEDYTLGVTNPVYLDVDGDGVFRSARSVAADLRGTLRSAADLPAVVDKIDDAVAVQLASMVFADGDPAMQDALRELAKSVAERPMLGRYLADKRAESTSAATR